MDTHLLMEIEIGGGHYDGRIEINGWIKMS